MLNYKTKPQWLAEENPHSENAAKSTISSIAILYKKGNFIMFTHSTAALGMDSYYFSYETAKNSSFSHLDTGWHCIWCT